MKHDKDPILAEVRLRFSKKGRSAGRAYRADQRKLALRALDAGRSVGAVAAAAGVSRQSVLNWKKCIAGQAAPVELQVVAEPPTAISENIMARVLLRSGAVLEIPLARLDARLLALLGGGAW